jgi:hypothetical protein
MENPFAEALSDLKEPNYKILPFEQQCGYYAALLMDVPHSVVASVSGLKQPVVSHLSRAGRVISGRVRYPRVAREYRALGHEGFIHRYLTAKIYEDCLYGIAERKRVREAKRAQSDGIPANVMRYCRRYEWPKTELGMHVIFRIEQHADGFLWRNLKPFQREPEVPPEEQNRIALRGDDADHPFKTPIDCFRFLKEKFQPIR